MLVNPDGQKATWTFKAPSPSVTKVELTPPTSSIEFRLVGSNLAEAGTIHIDDKEVAKDKHELTVTGTTGMDPLAPGLFKQLSVVIKKPDTSWAEKRNHKVLLTNPDKQTVQTEYTVS